jgi:hypothetical protein
VKPQICTKFISRFHVRQLYKSCGVIGRFNFTFTFNNMSSLPTDPSYMPVSPKTPPYLLNTDHRQRCLEQLRSKSNGLEKYIYLSGLKKRDPNLFYDVLLSNMLEIIPILYTPTVLLLSINYFHMSHMDLLTGWGCMF